MTTDPSGPIDRDLNRLVDGACALAEQAGLQEIGDRFLDIPAAESPSLPRVVVAGETKRGKSSLVNALIGRPLLSPVGEDVVTATYIVFRFGKDEAAVALVADPSGGAARRVPIGLHELADYTSVDAVHERVLGAEVTLDAPLLNGIDLVDSPGVGGLVRGHTAVTMALLDTASALLFVMDASAPLSLPELRFLTEAGRRNDTIVLVMTKTDLYPDWDSLLKDDRELIAQHVPALRDVPVIGVSSRLADEASRLAADTSEAAAQLRRISGLEGLVEQLRTRVSRRAKRLTAVYRARTVRRTLEELRARLGEHPEYLAREPQALDALTAERDRLKAFLVDPHAGVLDVHRRLTRLRRDMADEFDREVAGLLDRYTVQVETCAPAVLKEIPALMEAELVQVAAHHLENVSDELVEIIAGLERRVGSAPVFEEVRTQLGTEITAAITSHADSVDRTSYALSAAEEMVGGSAMLLLGGWLTAGPVGLAISVAAVVTGGIKKFRDEKHASRRQTLTSWLDRAGREVRRSFDGACSRRIDALEHVLDFELPRLLDQRVAHLDGLARSSATLGPSGGPATVFPAAVDELLARTDDLILRLRTA